MLYYNAQHGFVEGLIRGLRVGLLNSQNYVNLTQCETLGTYLLFTIFKRNLINCSEDLKLQLSATEYGNFLANVPSPISTSIIFDKATEKLVEEFNYLRAQAVGDFEKFFDYITYSYQIDNVVLLITGTLHERDTHELLERCHPLGWFNSLPALCVATTVEELYDSVLIETPLGKCIRLSLTDA
jgi:V-type H+-transporting ATPase subunit d